MKCVRCLNIENVLKMYILMFCVVGTGSRAGVVRDSRSKPGRCYRLQSCRVQIPEEKKN